MKTGLFSLTLLITGVFCIPSAVLAQDVMGIAISPLVFEISGNPGEVVENQVKITNRSDSTTEITMTVEDIAPSDEAGHVIVEPAETETYSVARWISITPKKFSLDPGEGKWVTFTLSLPLNAEPGGHYGTVVAAGSIISGSSATGAFIVPRVGALLLVSVPGEINEDLTIRDFTAPTYSEYGPINFEVSFKNTGTIHLKANGLITITNWLGQKVAEIPYPEKNVLPDSVRKIEASWPQKWLWAGRYTATLTGTYGVSNKQLSPTVITFWAFPWKVGIIILVFVFFLILARKRFIEAFRILLLGNKKR
jgi:hypothetical protein